MHYYNYSPVSVVNFKEQRNPTNLGFAYENEFKPVKIDKIDGRLLDNIVEYNKNLTPDEINGTMNNNILKYNNLMTLSEFDKMLIAKQYQKLYGKSDNANMEQIEKYENNKFINLSLSEITYKFTETMAQLIHEIPIAYEKNELNYDMFVKEDRKTYIGIFFVLLSIIIYFVSISS